MGNWLGSEDLLGHGSQIDLQDVFRLNILLNKRPNCYLKMKGYSVDECVCLEGIMFADCKLNTSRQFQDFFVEDGSGRSGPHRIEDSIQVILYFNGIPEKKEGEKFIESRKMFVVRVQRLIMDLCREFISKSLNTDNVKIIAKGVRQDDEYENTLFIWANGKLEYFPLLFDASESYFNMDSYE